MHEIPDSQNSSKQTPACNTDQSQIYTSDQFETLKQELRAKEEYLQTTNEELETSNEELKSSNEEMQSINEELQSTNEELKPPRKNFNR